MAETPLMLANNVYRNGTLTVTSEDTSYPKTNLIDNARFTKWKATSSATQNIQIQLAAANQRLVDTLIIDTGHNLLAAGASITFQRSTNGSSWTDLVASVAATAGIIVKRFTAAPYAYYRLHITGATVIPELIQLWAGASFSLTRAPKVPFDPDMAETEIIKTVTEGGVPQHSKKYTRRKISADWSFIETAFYTNFSQWWTDTGQGSRPFWWILEPDTDPTDAQFMILDNPVFAFPSQGSFRTGDFDAVEVLG